MPGSSDPFILYSDHFCWNLYLRMYTGYDLALHSFMHITSRIPLPLETMTFGQASSFPGAVPFKASSIMGLYTEICDAQLVFPAGIFVSEALKHLIKGLLDKNPETRMSLATAMRHPWITYNGEWAFPSTLEVRYSASRLQSLDALQAWQDTTRMTHTKSRSGGEKQ